MKKRPAFLLATSLLAAPLTALAGGDGTNPSFNGCSGCSNSPAYNGGRGNAAVVVNFSSPTSNAGSAGDGIKDTTAGAGMNGT